MSIEMAALTDLAEPDHGLARRKPAGAARENQRRGRGRNRQGHRQRHLGKVGAYRQVAALIPERTPVILESVIAAAEIHAELDRAHAARPVAGEWTGPRMAVGGWLPVAGD